VPLSDSLGCCHDRLRRALRVGLEEGALWLPESDPHDLAAQRTKRPKRRITIILATLMPSAGCVGLGCRVLAESRQSCPRRTTFLRFAGMGVGARCRCPGSAGLRFYVSRAIAFATQGSHPGAPLVRLLGLLDFVLAGGDLKGGCRSSALDNPRSCVACWDNNSRGLRTLYQVVLDDEQSQAQLEKGLAEPLNVARRVRPNFKPRARGSRSGSVRAATGRPRPAARD
jgi:hypothetical protein